MNGSKTNLMNREQILDAMKTPPSDGYYVWDGVNEDDRPATMKNYAPVLPCRVAVAVQSVPIKHRLPYVLISVCWRLSDQPERAGKPA